MHTLNHLLLQSGSFGFFPFSIRALGDKERGQKSHTVGKISACATV